jgi:hypothetical protein
LFQKYKTNPNRMKNKFRIFVDLSKTRNTGYRLSRERVEFRSLEKNIDFDDYLEKKTQEFYFVLKFQPRMSYI